MNCCSECMLCVCKVAVKVPGMHCLISWLACFHLCPFQTLSYALGPETPDCSTHM